MIAENEIAAQLFECTERMIEKKLNSEDSTLYFGIASGLLIALGKEEGFLKAESIIEYIYDVILEINRKQIIVH